jgi:vacuolar-type H+-ATPase subunit C/Vma6
MRQELASASGQGLRKKYFNNLGHLYPGRTEGLNSAKEFKDLIEKLDGTSYQKLMANVPDPLNNEASGPEIE